MIKAAETVLAKMRRGAEMRRGCFGGWYLYRGTVRLGRVSASAAAQVIESANVLRSDDRASVVGETYKATSTN